jgi:hypothetical protein
LVHKQENKEPPISETSIDIDVGNEGNSEMKELADFFAEVNLKKFESISA